MILILSERHIILYFSDPKGGAQITVNSHFSGLFPQRIVKVSNDAFSRMSSERRVKGPLKAIPVTWLFISWRCRGKY